MTNKSFSSVLTELRISPICIALPIKNAYFEIQYNWTDHFQILTVVRWMDGNDRHQHHTTLEKVIIITPLGHDDIIQS